MKKFGKIVLAFGTILLFACGGGNEKAALSGSIRIDGSSTVYPITEAIAEEFRADQPAVKVTIGVSGTGGGFKQFGKGEIDICNASRLIKSKEADACSQNNIDHIGLSVAYDGLAVLVHPKNTWVDHFTTAELNKIWNPAAQGTILYWDQIREGWPHEELHLFGPGTASGTYDYFAEVICGKDVGTRGDYTASEDDNVLVQGISTDKNGLGFFGLAYYQENKDKLKLVGIDNGSGVIAPSMETVSNGTYAPLSRPIFIYVSSKAAENAEINEFVNYYLDMAPSLVAEVGFIPLTNDEYALEKTKYADFIKKYFKTK